MTTTQVYIYGKVKEVCGLMRSVDVYSKDIYHLLSRAFGQCVAVP